MAEIENELQKEFELERMILFSDAVFAIAITLLILEVKFPHLPEGASSAELRSVFKPVIIRFMAFVISFFFIGSMWARHLRLFKYLRSYNNTIIFLNLLFIFFIVCFPFSVSGFSDNSHSHSPLPVFLYISNITLVLVAQAVLCYYLFRQDSEYTMPGFNLEKKYLLLQSVWTAIIFIITIVLMAIIYGISGNYLNLIFAIYALPVMILILKRRLKKYKPPKQKSKASLVSNRILP